MYYVLVTKLFGRLSLPRPKGEIQTMNLNRLEKMPNESFQEVQ